MSRLMVIPLGLLAVVVVAAGWMQAALGRISTQFDSVSGITLGNASAVEGEYVSSLRDYGPAPEISGESWLNTDVPLRLSNLKGKVVLLDMWTFGCINCINIIPSVRDWHEKYAEQGLVIIGNHFPEFSYEHDIANIRDALVRLDVPYPVTQDNNGDTWNAYNNRYWPTVYLIDKRGDLRYQHIGEGAYSTTEAAIQDLLKETYTSPAEETTATALEYVTATSDLNVRSGSSIDAAIIGAIKPGEVFVVRGAENGWYRIQYNDGEGFVSGEFVTVSITGEAAS